MYKIIGADGKEYGPITTDQLRQWIAEGRVNAQTQILPEGGAEWKTLADLPEFMASMPSVPPSLPSAPMYAPGMSPPGADQVTGPAIGLIVTAILGFLLQATSLVWRLALSAAAANQPQGPWAQMPWASEMFSGTLAVVSAIIGIVVSAFILFGGIKMKKLENYGLAMAASIIAMIPCISPCCLIGLPIGIWALVILSRPEVKGAFH